MALMWLLSRVPSEGFHVLVLSPWWSCLGIGLVDSFLGPVPFLASLMKWWLASQPAKANPPRRKGTPLSLPRELEPCSDFSFPAQRPGLQLRRLQACSRDP